ncbi:MAG: hypothetical protein CAF44_001775 [Nitrospira sp. CG24D]|jgi:hypothetical protein|nr:MAG: hypothetical protein CAF44_001775 [Nitrospira sp. CG24D]
MAEHDLEKLLGGFAADTLTPEERRQLFTAAMQDQQLFNALADEQALKELLTDPAVRRRLLQSLNSTTPAPAGRSASWLDWFRRPANLALAGGFATAVFAVVLGTKIYQDSLKQKAQLVATEATPPTVPSVPAPAATQPSAPKPAESKAKTQENQSLSATAAKKDSLADTGVTRERTATAQPQASVPADTIRDYARKNTQPEADRKQVAAPTASMGKTSEDVAARAERPRAAGSPPATAVPEAKPAQTTAGTSLPETSLSAISARGLFYGPETGRMAQTPERAIKPLAEAEPQTSPLKRKLEGLSQLSKAAGSIEPDKPLGLRYSFVIQTPDGQAQEVDAAAASTSSTPVQLTIETNQDGYIQVWRNVGSANTQLLLPQKDSGHISQKIQAGQRQRLVLPAESGTVIVRLAHVPFGPISRQEAALLNRRSPNLLQESGTSPSPTGSQEQATYVVSQDPSPTAQIAVDILLAQQQ